MHRPSSTTILIVDDDENFLSAVKSILVSKQYQVIVTNNAKTGKETVGMAKVDLVLCDIRMPALNGIELLHYVNKNSQVPVILMTGFSEIKDSAEALELGAKAYLPKPFKKDELIGAIGRILDINPSEVPPLSQEGEVQTPKISAVEEEYCKVGVEYFVSGSDLKYDIYLKLSDTKYVKIANSGESISLDRIRVYRTKGLTHLYLKRHDFRNYINFASKLSQIASVSSLITKSKKIQLVQHVSNVIFEQFYLYGVDEEIFKSTHELVEASMGLLNDQHDACRLLESLNQHSNMLFSHSVGVSFYSTMIAKKLGWNSYGTLFKLSVGGLLHDIGKKELHKDLLEKPRASMNAEEIEIYESHTVRGVEMLSKMQSINSDIIRIIQEHHENCIGYGYRRRLDAREIHPLAKVVGLANAFCELVIKNANSEGFAPRIAIDRLKSLCRDHYDSEALTALAKIFKD